ncbi:sodium/nucleoside cotransporter 1 [Condylostylus longicornis]|uniref:sodium/nucleoside cotransporter 1 n=1 Tax=Condylostylus longicornis TaxID=2530218 RepID=UPI00244DCF2C|nr:sodium/nucleoside cotransporter 1 [Condylostylus longicornis]
MNGKDNIGYSNDENDIPLKRRQNDDNFSTLTIGPDSRNEENSNDNNEDNDEPSALMKFYEKNKKIIKFILIVLTHIIVGSYFAYATYFFVDSENKHRTWEIYPDPNNTNITDGRCHGSCGFQFCDGYGMLLIVTCIVYICLIYYYIIKPVTEKPIGRLYDNTIKKILIKRVTKTLTVAKIFGIILAILVIIGIAIYLFIETKDDPKRLVSLAGPFVFISLGYIFSADRQAIKWRPVLVGITGQFILGVICIRWDVGRKIFQCLGDKVVTFLNYSRPGSIFVYGAKLVEWNTFYFALLSVIFFFSFFISILYYLGAMQFVVQKIGWMISSLLGTTACESLNAGANIFLGMSESPLLIRPYLNLLTHSEIHAVMASGFATVSGTVLAAYVSYGASAALLITSSVMAAPAALGMAKLYYPENEKTKTGSNQIQMEKSGDSSILDAASNGASNAIPIVLGIAANIIAFIAFIAFLNGIINWLGYLVGLDNIDFEWVMSKVFMPISWIIGIEWSECEKVGRVIAAKTVVNEFVAYEKLGALIKANKISPRAAGITTFAICGFANPSSLGIMMGALGTMAPGRKKHITKVAMRSFIVGCFVCFTSASFAGLMMSDEFLAEQQR